MLDLCPPPGLSQPLQWPLLTARSRQFPRRNDTKQGPVLPHRRTNPPRTFPCKQINAYVLLPLLQKGVASLWPHRLGPASFRLICGLAGSASPPSRRSVMATRFGQSSSTLGLGLWAGWSPRVFEQAGRRASRQSR